MKKIITGTWKEYLPGDEEKLVKDAGYIWSFFKDLNSAKEQLGYNSEYEEDYLSDLNHMRIYIFFPEDSNVHPVGFNLPSLFDCSIFGSPEKDRNRPSGISILETNLGPLLPELCEKVRTVCHSLNLSDVEWVDDITTEEERLFNIGLKMSKKQPLEKDELAFLFEVDRQFEICADDDRYGISQLRDYYYSQAKESGVLSDAQEELLTYRYNSFSLPEQEASEKFMYFLNDESVNKDLLLSAFSFKRTLNSEAFLAALACDDIEAVQALDLVSSETIAENLEKIMAMGDNDLNDIAMHKLPEAYVSAHIVDLIDKGMNMKLAVLKASADAISKNFYELVRLGFDINRLVYMADSQFVDKEFKHLIDQGAKPGAMLGAMSSMAILRNLNFLLKNGLDRRIIIENVYPNDVFRYLKWLHEERGFDINMLASVLKPDQVRVRLKYLVQHGMTLELLLKILLPMNIIDLKDKLISYGMEIDLQKIVDMLEPDVVLYRLDDIMPLGANLDLEKIAKAADLEDVKENAYELIDCGVSREFIAELLDDPSYLSNNENIDDTADDDDF